jgi:hypothetical protein
MTAVASAHERRKPELQPKGQTRFLPERKSNRYDSSVHFQADETCTPAIQLLSSKMQERYECHDRLVSINGLEGGGSGGSAALPYSRCDFHRRTARSDLLGCEHDSGIPCDSKVADAEVMPNLAPLLREERVSTLCMNEKNTP